MAEKWQGKKKRKKSGRSGMIGTSACTVFVHLNFFFFIKGLEITAEKNTTPEEASDYL